MSDFLSGMTDLASDPGPCSGMQTMQSEAGTPFHLYRKESLISLKCLLCSTNTEVIRVYSNTVKSSRFFCYIFREECTFSDSLLHNSYWVLVPYLYISCFTSARRLLDGSYSSGGMQITVPSAGLDPEPLLTDSCRHFDRPKSAIWREAESQQDVNRRQTKLYKATVLHFVSLKLIRDKKPNKVDNCSRRTAFSIISDL